MPSKKIEKVNKKKKIVILFSFIFLFDLLLFDLILILLK